MRQGYKFIRESGCEHDDDYLSHLFNDIFCWTNGTYKLCYTRPDMEAVNGDNILDIENGENKILSFDYHMQLLVCKRNDRENTENDKKADNEESDRDEWETLINASAYDFPNVRQLKADIRTILDSNMEDAQIVRDNSGEPYEKVLCLGTEGIYVEDGYVLRRIKRYTERDTPDRYELEVGTNCGVDSGIAQFYRLTGLNREDIRSLYTCATRFIENAEDLYNHRLKLRRDREKHNKKIDGEVLMCLENSFELVTEGEELASIKYWDFRGEKLTEEYNARVWSIDGDAGSIDLGSGEMLYMDQIYSIDKKSPTEEMLCMGVEEIAEDFCGSILVKTVTMLDDFGTMEVYDLCEKYGEYIDNRYYMYREEHGFEMPEDVVPGDGVKPYVEKVIRLLKSKV